MAIIGFASDNNHVTEGVDNSANLTVELISGQLGREVVVSFSTSYPSDSAATSMLYMLFILIRCILCYST